MGGSSGGIVSETELSSPAEAEKNIYPGATAKISHFEVPGTRNVHSLGPIVFICDELVPRA